MSTRFADRVCLVTGSTGIAAAAATALAAEGGSVFVVSRDETHARASAEQITAAGGTSAWHAADLATEALTVRQSSGSTINLSGSAARLDLNTSSGSTFDGEKLRTDHCRAEASSGSSARIAVKEDLVAEASSGGSVRYYGAPALTKRTSSGGSVSGR